MRYLAFIAAALLTLYILGLRPGNFGHGLGHAFRMAEHNATAIEPPIFIGDIPFQDLQGNSATISNFTRGNTGIVGLWANWCGYCATEMPQMDKFHARTQDQPDAPVLVPLASSGKDTPQNIRAFYSQHDIRSLPTLTTNGDYTLMQRLNLRGFPAFVLVNKEGYAVALMRPHWDKTESLMALVGVY